MNKTLVRLIEEIVIEQSRSLIQGCRVTKQLHMIARMFGDILTNILRFRLLHVGGYT